MSAMLNYKCLVLDHDDTAVKSSPDINYPSFLETLAALRPDYRPDFEEFMTYCCEPGFHAYCTEVLKFDEREMGLELETWRRFTASRVPEFYEGVADALREYKAAGGVLCVVSHSYADNIRRDYERRCPDAPPDLVFGWEQGEGRRKPDPWPIEETMRVYGFEAADLLVVDDMLTGHAMAQSCGVKFACAGWSHAATPAIAKRMREHSEIYLETPKDMLALLME